MISIHLFSVYFVILKIITKKSSFFTLDYIFPKKEQTGPSQLSSTCCKISKLEKERGGEKDRENDWMNMKWEAVEKRREHTLWKREWEDNQGVTELIWQCSDYTHLQKVIWKSR